MTHWQKTLSITTNGQGLYEITNQVVSFVRETGCRIGLSTVFIRHTSCSLIIQENADPDVQTDLSEFFSRLVPENMNWVRHASEGPDDMPAHIKSALTNVSLSVPINDTKLLLGTWQGIYIFEHRKANQARKVVIHVHD